MSIRGPATARRILESYLSRIDPLPWLADHARALLSAFEHDPRRVSALVLGDLTPKGSPTFEALVKEAHPKRPIRTIDWGSDFKSSEPEPQRFRSLPIETRPTEKLILIDQGPEGGPETPASEYPYHRLKYEKLNAVQTLVLPWVDRDVNLVVATSTSSGKSIVAEMFMGEGISRGGSAVFLSPLRAVSQEKYDDWTDESHPWKESGKQVEIVTGDYVLTDSRRRALSRADVVVMTSESLDAKSRRIEAEGLVFLTRCAVMAIDEAHLLTMEGRGDALESGIMRFTRKNPAARMIFLSATMPNVEQLGRWLTSLNGKPTVVIRSAWRPTKLTVWWPTYKEGGSYHWNEESKKEAAIAIIRRFPKDKFLIFVHAKKAGWALLDRLRGLGIKSEFHNADRDRESRLDLERDFRDGDLRVLVATSTLAWGINAPARRVIVLGVHRGMDEVDPIDVKQEVGRAGRYGLDPEGDAYILLPQKRAAALRAKFEQIGKIESRLNDEDTLAFHLTAEVAEGGVETGAAAVAWHARSFAAFQGRPLPEKGVELAPLGTPERTHQIMSGQADHLSAAKVLERLTKVGIISKDERGRHKATQLGRVASWLYFSPFDVADWCGNFRRLVERDKYRDDDAIAWALGHIKTSFEQRTPREVERESREMGERIRSMGLEYLRVTPAVLAYRAMLRGEEALPLAGIQRGLKHDIDRVLQALNLIDQRVLRSLGDRYTETLSLRLKNGVGWQEAELCRLPGIGGKRATMLFSRGIRSIAAVVERQNRVRQILPGKNGEAAIAGAKKILAGEPV